MVSTRRLTIIEGAQAAKDGLHIKQNPYSTRNWSDGDLRAMGGDEIAKLYGKATYWNRGYKSVKK